MKEAYIAAYASSFNDITMFCPNFVTTKYKKVERYIWGLVQPIQKLVTASKPTIYNSAMRLDFTLTNQVMCMAPWF